MSHPDNQAVDDKGMIGGQNLAANGQRLLKAYPCHRVLLELGLLLAHLIQDYSNCWIILASQLAENGQHFLKMILRLPVVPRIRFAFPQRIRPRAIFIGSSGRILERIASSSSKLFWAARNSRVSSCISPSVLRHSAKWVGHREGLCVQ